MNNSRLQPCDLSDRNLLFGVLALQLDLINQPRFVEVCAVWAARKELGLADLLLERGWISAEQKLLLNKLIEEKWPRNKANVEKRIREAAAQNATVEKALSAVLSPAAQDDLAEEPAETEDAFFQELRKDISPFKEGAVVAGKYLLRQELGTGSFGSVWLAKEAPPLNGLVALKTLKPSVLRDQPDQAVAALTALQQEASVLRRVNHPNVIKVYNWEQAGDTPFLVLQYVSGGTMAQRLAAQGPLPWKEAVQCIADVGDGLVAVHAQNILHRDIKPSNILWDKDYHEAVLTDFGVAGRLIGGETLAGTPRYMAPEAFDRRACPASDVFSLAATLYQLLTNTLPFSADTYQERLAQIGKGLPVPDARLNRAPPGLLTLLRTALALEPNQRPELRTFVESVRTTLNQWLIDELLPTEKAVGETKEVDLTISIVRHSDGKEIAPLSEALEPADSIINRDVKPRKRVRRVALQTGDRVRVEVTANEDGYITVFNLGPTGNFNLLCPDDITQVGREFQKSGPPIRLEELELVAPAGSERIVALWLRHPRVLPLSRLLAASQEKSKAVSRSYRSTRDIIRLEKEKEKLDPADYQVAVLELNHQAGN